MNTRPMVASDFIVGSNNSHGKIASFILFTNRNALICDKQGEQIVELQRKIGCYPSDPNDEQSVLLDVYESKPVIVLCRYGKWRHEISFTELCYMLGHGKWYESKVNDGTFNEYL